MSGVAQLIRQIKNGKVDPFRDCFELLSFEEIGQIYEAVTPHFGPQRHFDFKQFSRAAHAVDLSGVVVELGDHDGALAQSALIDFPRITEWVGFDVCEAFDLDASPNYSHVSLTDWFHKSVDLNGADAFVSTHTLEHMDTAKVMATLDFVSKSPVKKMIIEMPFRRGGTWKGSKSMHVFKGKPADITIALQQAGWNIAHRHMFNLNHTWGAVR